MTNYRCCQWILACGRDINEKTLEQWHTNNKVCSVHFSGNMLCGLKRLTEFADVSSPLCLNAQDKEAHLSPQAIEKIHSPRCTNY